MASVAYVLHRTTKSGTKSLKNQTNKQTNKEPHTDEKMMKCECPFVCKLITN